MHRPSEWTKSVLDKVLSHDANELRNHVRTCIIHSYEPPTAPSIRTLHLYCNDDPDTVMPSPCKCHSTMATIFEADVKEDNPLPRRQIAEMEIKLSNASCHKRARGYVRRIKQATREAIEQQEQRGLQRCSIQNDSGASHCITPDQSIILNYERIPDMPVDGLQKDAPALTAIGKGQIPFLSDEGNLVLAECLYAPLAACTIVSPTAITKQYPDVYAGWTIHANTIDSTGYLQLVNLDGVNHSTFNIYEENNLWWHYASEIPKGEVQPTIRRLSSSAEYALWHHRLGHPNSTALENAHKYCKGVPKLRTPNFYKCQTCMAAKIKKQADAPKHRKIPKQLEAEERIHPGQMMDALSPA